MTEDTRSQLKPHVPPPAKDRLKQRVDALFGGHGSTARFARALDRHASHLHRIYAGSRPVPDDLVAIIELLEFLPAGPLARALAEERNGRLTMAATDAKRTSKRRRSGGRRKIAQPSPVADLVMLAAQLIYAWFMWSLLIGQAVIFAVFFWDKGLIDNAWGAEIMLSILAVSGLVGLVGEWFWHRWQDQRQS